ncbi:MAG: DUF4178 domain-containing protein [Bacteroidota bacterium]
MFNLFKKKQEPSYDITNLKITDLDVGFILDYDLKSWVVKEKYEYDWGDNNFSHEYKIDSGDDVAFLSVEDDGNLNLALFRPIKIRKIDEEVADEIVKNEKAPRQLHYDGDVYYLDADSAGYYRDCAKKTEDWEELISFEYYTDGEEKVLSITQWDEQTFEASAGVTLETHEISNIIPGQ